ncbi:ZIP family metal transporter [Candidatus Woesearchaeota archaeon]|nr:ZIP family metal transporter [Candidatus Woesearchaeota archaeon]
MDTIWLIILSTIIISLTSFVGIITLVLKRNLTERVIYFLVALSAGTLLGGAFIHLIPESLEIGNIAFGYVILGFIIFFFIEKVLHWRHCHKGHCAVHEFASMTLIGDSIHNFIDGLALAAAFVIDFRLGWITTIAIASHEIPQELGDFGVLIHGGFSKARALFMNFIVAATAILGGVVGYFMNNLIESFTPILLAITAGGFIYISASDLIPELRNKATDWKMLINFFIFVMGIFLMYVLSYLE